MAVIKTKPWAYINTLNVVVGNSSYTSHANNGDYTDMIQEPADAFSGIMWFHGLDQVSAIRSDPSVRALDDLVSTIGSTRAASVIASCPVVSAALRAKFGLPVMWYLGRIDSDDDAAYWREHIAAGTMESEVDRLLAYIPADDWVAVDSIGILPSSSEFAPILDYLIEKYPFVYSEGAARSDFHPYRRNCPNLTILASARNVSSWANYRTPRIVWRTQTYQDDFVSPVPSNEWVNGIDYASTQIPLVRNGDYILITYNGASEWDTAMGQFNDLLDNAGILSLADANGGDLGNDGGEFTAGAVPLGSEREVTLRIINQTTATVTLGASEPTIGGAADGGSITGGQTILDPGDYNEFSIVLDTSAAGDQSATIEVTHDGDDSPFTFTYNFRVVAPGGGGRKQRRRRR